MIEEKVQKNVFEIVDLHNVNNKDYWHDRNPKERIEAIEFMRKVMFGRDRTSARLQRVLTIAELKEN